jgi:hypothetical protein
MILLEVLKKRIQNYLGVFAYSFFQGENDFIGKPLKNEFKTI